MGRDNAPRPLRNEVLINRSFEAETAIDALVTRDATPPAYSDAVIIGGGLSGLVVAAALRGDGLTATVLEGVDGRRRVAAPRQHGQPRQLIGAVVPAARRAWRGEPTQHRTQLPPRDPRGRAPAAPAVVPPRARLRERVRRRGRRSVRRGRARRRARGAASGAASGVARGVAGDTAAAAAADGGVASSEDGGTLYRVSGVRGAAPFEVRARMVIVCTNRRLGARRADARRRARVRGQVRRGLAGDVATVEWDRREVVIIGMGAFAVEAMRTALEGGAKRVTILCRRRGTVCPQLIDWLFFVRPFGGEGWAHDPAGDSAVLAAWQRAYDLSGAARPECWADGLLKPDGHTVSVSDLFFVAHHLGLVTTVVGEAARLTRHGVLTTDGAHLDAQVVVKCVGFETSGVASALIGAEAMRGFGLVDGNLWVQAEPHLDGGRLQAARATSTSCSSTPS